MSHLILVGLLLGVCLIAVAGFLRLGWSVNQILEDNYKSVVAAQNMKEALERIDSAAAFYVAGQEAQAHQQYQEYLPLFEAAYRVEANNVTEQGEQAVSDDLGARFVTYKKNIVLFLSDDKARNVVQSRRVYFSTLQPQFVGVKKRVQDVLDLNQTAIVSADEKAKSDARNAAIASIVITALAVLIGLGLAQRNIAALMTPLISLTRQAEEIGAGHLHQRIETRRADEIGTLARTFNMMAERLEQARREEVERLHRAERMSGAALADLYDPVVVADANGKVAYLNRAAEGLFGADHTARGRAVQNVVKNQPLGVAITAALDKQEVTEGDSDATHTTLAGRTYRIRASPMADTENATLLGAVAILEDVTNQQEVNRLKTEFIGVASHELRTPVTSLLLGIELLEEGAVGELSPSQREVVEALHTDLTRLERMMRDLLDLTRLEAGATPPRFEVVLPDELIEGACRTVETQATAKGVILKKTDTRHLPAVRADREQVGRVLVNLLSNAIRHTPSEGTITVGAAREAGQIRFAVQDTGTGIPTAYLPHVFERFVQVPGATRGGAGLGLSIAQTVVEAHGGKMEVQSEVDKGSTFTFRLHTASDDTAVGNK